MTLLKKMSNDIEVTQFEKKNTLKLNGLMNYCTLELKLHGM